MYGAVTTIGSIEVAATNHNCPSLSIHLVLIVYSRPLTIGKTD